jgi:DNA gyrase subunit A
MEEITVHGRVTSGVKMINLDKGVSVVAIAKVREKISNGDEEFEDIEDAMEDIPEEVISEEDLDSDDFDETDDSDDTEVTGEDE